MEIATLANDANAHRTNPDTWLAPSAEVGVEEVLACVPAASRRSVTTALRGYAVASIRRSVDTRLRNHGA